MWHSECGGTFVRDNLNCDVSDLALSCPAELKKKRVSGAWMGLSFVARARAGEPEEEMVNEQSLPLKQQQRHLYHKLTKPARRVEENLESYGFAHYRDQSLHSV